MKPTVKVGLAVLGCALAFCAGTAKASVVNFNVNGNYTAPTSGSFSGTMAIDVATGAIVSADIVFPGFPDMTNIFSSVQFNIAPVNGWLFDIANQPSPPGFSPSSGQFAELIFTTTTPDSLIGFVGGTIVGDAAVNVGPGVFFAGNGSYNGSVFSGTITAATPLPAALPLFATGLGGLGLLSWRRKRKAQAGLATKV